MNKFKEEIKEQFKFAVIKNSIDEQQVKRIAEFIKANYSKFLSIARNIDKVRIECTMVHFIWNDRFNNIDIILGGIAKINIANNGDVVQIFGFDRTTYNYRKEDIEKKNLHWVEKGLNMVIECWDKVNIE